MKTEKKRSIQRAAQTAALLCVIAAVIAFARANAKTVQRAKPLQEEDGQALYAQIAASNVHVFSGTVRGEGTLFATDKGSLLILTCRHLAEDLTGDAYAVLSTGTRLPLALVYLSERSDLALLSAPSESLSAQDRAAVLLAAVDADAYERAASYDPVFLLHGTVTGTDGERSAVTDGMYQGMIADKQAVVEGLEIPMLHAYCRADAGMSGSGVYDRTGVLIGVLSAGGGDGEILCVPLPQLLTELSKFL